jgi:metal-responsive CopG/Arc/MetJ family transcriptional regulator
MEVAKITISLEQQLLNKIDRLIINQTFSNRSQAIQSAIKETTDRIERTRLAKECAKLDKNFEQAMADEGLSKELEEWPEY